MWLLDRTGCSLFENDNDKILEAGTRREKVGRGGGDEKKSQKKRKKPKKQEPQQQKQRWEGDEKTHFQKSGLLMISSEWAHSFLRQIISYTNN